MDTQPQNAPIIEEGKKFYKSTLFLTRLTLFLIAFAAAYIAYSFYKVSALKHDCAELRQTIRINDSTSTAVINACNATIDRQKGTIAADSARIATDRSCASEINNKVATFITDIRPLIEAIKK